MGHGFFDSNPLIGIEGKESVEEIVEIIIVSLSKD
jgi:hypothetical protein